MIAEGKLNLNALNGRNFEVEELKLKNLRNNMIIIFRYYNSCIYSILITNEFKK